jgi:hypothetical protein
MPVNIGDGTAARVQRDHFVIPEATLLASLAFSLLRDRRLSRGTRHRTAPL